MDNVWAEGLRVKITTELIFRITDPAGALRQAAIDSVDSADFVSDGGKSIEDARAEERSVVDGSPADAALWLSVPENMLMDVPGVVPETSESSAMTIADPEDPDQQVRV